MVQGLSAAPSMRVITSRTSASSIAWRCGPASLSGAASSARIAPPTEWVSTNASAGAGPVSAARMPSVRACTSRAASASTSSDLSLKYW
jgi:hypothetical protein